MIARRPSSCLYPPVRETQAVRETPPGLPRLRPRSPKAWLSRRRVRPVGQHKRTAPLIGRPEDPMGPVAGLLVRVLLYRSRWQMRLRHARVDAVAGAGVEGPAAEVCCSVSWTDRRLQLQAIVRTRTPTTAATGRGRELRSVARMRLAHGDQAQGRPESSTRLSDRGSAIHPSSVASA